LVTNKEIKSSIKSSVYCWRKKKSD